ncbi:MAG: phosphoribosyltransferase family protein [Pseudomonadales bacterium]
MSAQLGAYCNRSDVIVLGLPRGGVPVAKTVAEELGVCLGWLAVQKIRLPGFRPPIGALADGGVEVWCMDRLRGLLPGHAVVLKAMAKARDELEGLKHSYGGDHSHADLTGRCVIIVDDGIETGTTMRAAIKTVLARGAASVIVAVPAAPTEVVNTLRGECDEVICLTMPQPFHDLGQYYLDHAYPGSC